MKQHAVRNPILASLGLASLVIYILACGSASFSPDDKKVLYPTIDPQSGQVGVAVFDREARRSELIFVPHLRAGRKDRAEMTLLRPQWLPDGKGVVVAWPGREGTADDNDGLTVVMLPVDAIGPVRLFQLPDLKEAAACVTLPLPLAGHWLFLKDESNSVVRLDLITGAVGRHAFATEIIPYASPGPDRVAYVTQNDENETVEVGFLNPETFAQTSILRANTNELRGDAGLLALSSDGRKAAFLIKNGGEPQIRFKVDGAPAKTSSKLAKPGEQLALSSGQFSPKGDLLYTSFALKGGQTTNSAFGFLEVPADGGPVRRTTLISGGPDADDEAELLFQIGVSHDGKALAVTSAYLALADIGLAADDCALFLVDLSDPQRKVTKVPIPLPPKGKSEAKK